MGTGPSLGRGAHPGTSPGALRNAPVRRPRRGSCRRNGALGATLGRWPATTLDTASRGARARAHRPSASTCCDSDWGEAQPTRRGREPLPRPPHVGRVRGVAPGADRWRQRRDEGAATRSSSATSGASIDRRIIACHFRAAEWRHKAIELAAHDLLQYLDERDRRKVAGMRRVSLLHHPHRRRHVRRPRRRPRPLRPGGGRAPLRQRPDPRAGDQVMGRRHVRGHGLLGRASTSTTRRRPTSSASSPSAGGRRPSTS